MDTYPKFVLFDIEFWDPLQVTFPSCFSNISKVNRLFNGEIGEYNLALLQVSSCFDLKQTSTAFIDQVLIDKIQSKPVQDTVGTKHMLCHYGSNLMTKERHHQVHPSTLCQTWRCGLNTAKNTLKSTTQLGL